MGARFFLFLSGCLLATFSWGQSLTPFVVAPAGDFFLNQAANVSLSFTIGEMAMVETFTHPSAILTQGFHQPEDQSVAIGEGLAYINEFVYFPNPASDHLNVRYRLAHPGRLKMTLVNLNGVQVLPPFEDRYTGGLREETIPLEQLSQGMYMLQVSYEVPARGIHYISHHKINVIQ